MEVLPGCQSLSPCEVCSDDARPDDQSDGDPKADNAIGEGEQQPEIQQRENDEQDQQFQQHPVGSLVFVRVSRTVRERLRRGHR